MKLNSAYLYDGYDTEFAEDNDNVNWIVKIKVSQNKMLQILFYSVMNYILRQFFSKISPLLRHSLRYLLVQRCTQTISLGRGEYS